MHLKLFQIGIFLLVFSVLTGCAGMPNKGQMEMYTIPQQEAEWIRNGEPIEFDGKLWYPKDATENLLDSEVYLVGKYRGVEFFIDKMDVKPYDRMYTKFDRHRFRYFEPKEEE